MISDLLAHNADTKITDSTGNGPMHYCMAVFDKDPVIFAKTMHLLLRYGVNPNTLNKDGWSPLHIAVKKGIVEAVDAII